MPISVRVKVSMSESIRTTPSNLQAEFLFSLDSSSFLTRYV
jgi:hypothetical protein